MTTSLIDELEHALASGTHERRAAMLGRITDLFTEGASRYSESQLNLFDEVMGKLVVAIETKARAKLASRLAPIHTAPRGVIRSLAFDDDIEVARPVLATSERLDEADLIANASQKSQQHLAAIAERKSLSEALTDVLVQRGDPQVVHSVAKNRGARFSDAGFRLLVKRSTSDDTLAMHVGARRDLPRHHFLRLLQEASAAVRTRLAAEHPEAGSALESVLGEVVGGIRNEARKVSRDYAAARDRVEALRRGGRLGETEVYAFARERKFEETAVALAILCSVENDVVERALLDPADEMVLIVAKLAGFSSTTAKAILLLKAADRGLSAHALEQALSSYSRLQMETARRVLDFYRVRIRGQAGPMAAAG
ncbi:MAG: DUF2336 domain-containing protein [Hyphomicrobiales bacterium]|nr:DUF2336 domain-containing protein [Hyphomicrobiales bacterium]